MYVVPVVHAASKLLPTSPLAKATALCMSVYHESGRDLRGVSRTADLHLRNESIAPKLQLVTRCCHVLPSSNFKYRT